jgi:DNA-binding MarR family transcriptional regulator
VKIKSRLRKLCDALARLAADADERASDGTVSEISHGELLALEACVDGARTVASIANRLALSIPTTMDVLRRLEHKLLIKRTPATGRVNTAPFVDLTSSGRKTIERMKSFDSRVETEFRSMIPRFDIEKLRVAIEHMNESEGDT